MDTFSRDDLVELIYKKDGQMKCEVFTNKTVKTAEKMLKTFTANIRLDYHGVIDLTEVNDPLIPKDKRDKYQICAISFTGTQSEQRMKTREDIMKRIESGQINFGIINFVRCYDKKQCSTFKEPGSKAWVNSLIRTGSGAIFIDDSNDHYQSVQSLNIKNLKAILFKGIKKDLLKIIDNIDIPT
jgi:hypothetical protein